MSDAGDRFKSVYDSPRTVREETLSTTTTTGPNGVVTVSVCWASSETFDTDGETA